MFAKYLLVLGKCFIKLLRNNARDICMRTWSITFGKRMEKFSVDIRVEILILDWLICLHHDSFVH